MELEVGASQELKSLVSSINSQQVSRSETPIEPIHRIPSPSFTIPAPENDSPITISSNTESRGSPSEHPEETAPGKADSLKDGALDPRYTAVLHSLAEVKANQLAQDEKMAKIQERLVELGQDKELETVLKAAPEEFRKNLTKQVNEIRVQMENNMKGLSDKISNIKASKLTMEEPQIDWDAFENREAFKRRFRQEAHSMEHKNKVKEWINGELASFQVNYG